MPCNAHNHAPDCNCGWGGVFHPTVEGHTYGPGYWSREGSYSNPNAKCPVCGASVFFYRSPDNGRVYFDHPGPPWPKHPCTSGGDVRGKTPWSNVNRPIGWFAFPLKFILRVNSEISALINTQGRVLYVRFDSKRLDLESPVWIRSINNNKTLYEISLLAASNGVMVGTHLEGHTKLHELTGEAPPSDIADDQAKDAGIKKTTTAVRIATNRAQQFRERAAKQAKAREKLKLKEQKAASPKKSKKHPSPKKQKVDKPKSMPKYSNPSGPTAMQIAFSLLANTEEGQRKLGGLLGPTGASKN